MVAVWQYLASLASFVVVLRDFVASKVGLDPHAVFNQHNSLLEY